MNAQETANNILVDLDAESQRDLLSDAGTAPVGITTFHRHDGVDEVFRWSLRARPTPAPRRKQHSVFSFPHHTLEMQQGGRLQNDGVARAEREVNLLTAFRSAGLLEFDENNRVISWQATTWQAGASAAVMLNPTANVSVMTKVRQLLDRLAADPENGISEVLKAEGLHSLGGFPQGAFLIGLKPGYRLGSRTTGPLVITAKAGGMHGYLPQQPEMNASFLIMGMGTPAGHSLGEIDMRAIAPTLAGYLGIALPSADGKSCLNGLR